MKEKLYVFTDDHDWYVARNMNHVKELFFENTGETFENVGADDQNWYKLPDNKIISIVCYKEDFYPENELLPSVHVLEVDNKFVKIKATAAEWIKISEPGLLGSLDW